MDAEKNTMEQLMNGSFDFHKIKKGDMIEGEIISTYDGEVVVNINYFCDGVIKKEELLEEIIVGKNYLNGQKINVVVMELDDGTGNVSLSEKKAHFKNAINELKKAHKDEINVNVFIKDKVEAGLICDFKGIRGFIPRSRISINKVNMDEYINKNLEVKLIELDLDKNRIIFSRKEIEYDQVQKLRNEVMEKINIGDKFLGTVSNIKDFGVFVDIEGIQGFVHKSQITYKQNFNINDLVKIGDKVTVYVLDFDKKNQKIGLTMKEANYSPFLQYKNEFLKGNVYEVEIVKIISSGMIVSLNEELTGFIHISEFDNEVNIQKTFKVGDKIKAKIIEINESDKKISLSYKQAFEEENHISEYVENEENSTFGDIFKDVFSKLKS